MDMITLALDDLERAVTLMNGADSSNQNMVAVFCDHARDKLNWFRKEIALCTVDEEWRNELTQRLHKIMGNCNDATLSALIGKVINEL